MESLRRRIVTTRQARGMDGRKIKGIWEAFPLGAAPLVMPVPAAASLAALLTGARQSPRGEVPDNPPRLRASARAESNVLSVNRRRAGVKAV